DAAGGRAKDGRGIVLSGAAGDARKERGGGRVEDVGEQPPSPLLHAHDCREAAARRRGIAILPDVRRDHARDEDDVVVLTVWRVPWVLCSDVCCCSSGGISSIGISKMSCAFTRR